MIIAQNQMSTSMILGIIGQYHILIGSHYNAFAMACQRKSSEIVPSKPIDFLSET